VRRAILARHGESELSVVGRTNGDPSVVCGLTAAGREQSRQLGRDLAGERIDLCVTSGFERSRATAELALEGCDTPRLVLPELNDIRVGSFEGCSVADYRAWAHSHDPLELAPGDGESRAQVVSRYVRAYRTILDRPEETILVVAHALPVRYVVDAAEGKDPAAVLALVPYAEPFRLSAEELAAAVDRLAAWAEHPAWAS
jgi:broad specificity phosphatase PhoE